MGTYDGMGDARMNGTKYPSLDEGKYVVEVDQVVYLKTREGYPATIVEYTVIESSSPASPPGVKRSYFQKMNVDAALGAIKGLSCALAGVDPKDGARVQAESKNLEEFMNQAVRPENPCKGIRIGVSVVKVPLKSDKTKTFPKHEFTPVEQA